jgi:hypothetical protein
MSKEYSKSHYDAKMELTKKDIKNGYVRLDTYAVYKANKLGEVDCCGVLFHNLKTIMRYSRKNPVQREVLALVNQTLRLAREEGVDIREALREELDILDEIYNDPSGIPTEIINLNKLSDMFSEENKAKTKYDLPKHTFGIEEDPVAPEPV